MSLPRNSRKGKLVLPDIDGVATQKDIAWIYQEAGFPVHPWIRTKTKISARRGKGFFNSPDVIETADDIDLWASRWQVGFACSWRTGLIAIDIDDPVAFLEWDIEFPETLTVSTGREGGFHLYIDFSHLRAVVQQDEWPKQGDIPGGTLKTNGFTGAPGSRHPNGRLYRAVSDDRMVARGSLELLRALAEYRNIRTIGKGEAGKPGYIGELLRKALVAGPDNPDDTSQHEAVLRLVNALEREMTQEAITGLAFPLLEKALPAHDTSDPWDTRGLAEMIGSTQNRVGTTVEEERLLAEISAMEPRLAGEEGEDWFWNSREDLTTIRQWGHAQKVSPWALLGEILTEVIARVPPTFVLPDIISDYGSLNMMFAITGESSSGKGGAASLARRALDIDEPRTSADNRIDTDMIPERWGVGSGEGLVKHYASRSLKDGQIRHAHTVIVSVSEVSSLNAMVSRASETLTGELNKFYMGEPLGFGYGDPTKRLNIPYYSYRGVLIVGVQPELSGLIVQDNGSGFSRRWMLLNASEMFPPDSTPPKPEPVKWSLPRGLHGLAHDAELPLQVMEVCDLAASEIIEARDLQYRNKGDRMQGHRLFTQEKFAAGLAILAMRTELTEEDWRLAAYAMERSDGLREMCQRALIKKEYSTARKEGRIDGVRQIASEVMKVQESDRRVWNLILKHVPATGRIAIGKLANKMRQHSPDAVKATAREMAKAGVIVREAGKYRGSPDTEWYSRPHDKKRVVNQG